MPEHLREQLAITAQKVSATFELGARARERMAARGEPDSSGMTPASFTGCDPIKKSVTLVGLAGLEPATERS